MAGDIAGVPCEAERAAWAQEASWNELLPIRGIECGHLVRPVCILARLFDSGADQFVSGAQLINAAQAVADGVNHAGRWGHLLRHATWCVSEYSGGCWPHTPIDFSRFTSAVKGARGSA